MYNLSKTFGVYKITNLIDGKFYVGSTGKSFTQRWYQHRRTLPKGKTHLARAYQKYGPENFEFSILEVCVNREDCIPREQYYIDNLKPEYNINPKASSCLGRKASEEEIEALRIRMRARMESNPEEKERLKAMAGNWLGKKRPPRTAEHTEKLRQVHLGRKQSPEEIEKRRQSLLGRSSPYKGHRPERPNCTVCGELVKERFDKRGYFKAYTLTCGSEECIDKAKESTRFPNKPAPKKGQRQLRLCPCGNPVKEYYSKTGEFKRYAKVCSDCLKPLPLGGRRSNPLP